MSDLIIGQTPANRPAGRVGAPSPAAHPGAGLSPAAPSPGAPSLGANVIVEGSQATFMEDVIDASREVPVLVDFWATWCGPCKTLTPALERVVQAAGGRLRLVKIDVDANGALVAQLGQLGLPVQSIPTVAAFWQGQIADMFQGALPESEIRRFAESLLKLAGGAMPAAEMATEAKRLLDAGEAQEAATLFSAVLETEPENAEAWGGLARALLALGEDADALAALDQAPPKIAHHAEIVGARSAITLAAEGREAAAGLGRLRTQVDANTADHAARYELAAALNGTGAREEAAEALLAILRADRDWNSGAARLQLIRLFEAWGLDDPVTLKARRRMSALLFA